MLKGLLRVVCDGLRCRRSRLVAVVIVVVIAPVAVHRGSGGGVAPLYWADVALDSAASASSSAVCSGCILMSLLLSAAISLMDTRPRYLMNLA